MGSGDAHGALVPSTSPSQVHAGFGWMRLRRWTPGSAWGQAGLWHCKASQPCVVDFLLVSGLSCSHDAHPATPDPSGAGSPAQTPNEPSRPLISSTSSLSLEAWQLPGGLGRVWFMSFRMSCPLSHRQEINDAGRHPFAPQPPAVCGLNSRRVRLP